MTIYGVSEIEFHTHSLFNHLKNGVSGIEFHTHLKQKVQPPRNKPHCGFNHVMVAISPYALSFPPPHFQTEMRSEGKETLFSKKVNRRKGVNNK
uniref:Uncharacterized protein n=1 Tax=Bacillus pumilus TaxID=1408 RepID=A0A9Q9PC38_BACPU|nr:hypothetical protein SBRMV_007 [Bacillus pumilus]